MMYVYHLVGELYVYTNWDPNKQHGLWKVDCGVWSGEDCPHNMSTRPRGKQMVNRTDLTVVILLVRKALRMID